MRRWRWKRILLLLAVVLLLAALPPVWSRIAARGRIIAVFSGEPVATLSDRSALRVIAYNIAHGRGQSPTNWTDESDAVRLARLDAIAALLRQADADVVVLNEVDFHSSWSRGVNQAAYLAEKAGYPHRAEQRNYDLNLYGRTWKAGNAILSRHPIRSAEVVNFPDFRWRETLAVGKKRGLHARLAVGERTVHVVAVHLSHRDEALRVASAEMLCDRFSGVEDPVIFAGDFNATPTGFPFARTTDAGRNAIEVIDAGGMFHRHPRDPPTAEQLTFPASDPKSVIDWIMIDPRSRFADYRVLPSDLSDHLPVLAEIHLGPRDD